MTPSPAALADCLYTYSGDLSKVKECLEGKYPGKFFTVNWVPDPQKRGLKIRISEQSEGGSGGTLDEDDYIIPIGEISKSS